MEFVPFTTFLSSLLYWKPSTLSCIRTVVQYKGDGHARPTSSIKEPSDRYRTGRVGEGETGGKGEEKEKEFINQVNEKMRVTEGG